MFSLACLPACLLLQLVDYMEDSKKQLIYMVLESGEVDLGTFLKKNKGTLTENAIRYIWQEILNCVKACHAEKVRPSECAWKNP